MHTHTHVKPYAGAEDLFDKSLRGTGMVGASGAFPASF